MSANVRCIGRTTCWSGLRVVRAARHDAVHVGVMDNLQKPFDSTSLAEFLSVSVRTVESWRSRKPSPYGPNFWFAGKKALYSVSDVEEWMNEQREISRSAGPQPDSR